MVKRLDKKVKGYILWEIQNYPASQRWLACHGNNKKSDGAVSRYQERRQQVADAICAALQELEPEQVEAVSLIYWKKLYNVAGAGYQIGASERTVYRWIDQVVYAVAAKMGLLEEDKRRIG